MFSLGRDRFVSVYYIYASYNTKVDMFVQFLTILLVVD